MCDDFRQYQKGLYLYILFYRVTQKFQFYHIHFLVQVFFLLLLLLFMTPNQSYPLCPRDNENIKMF